MIKDEVLYERLALWAVVVRAAKLNALKSNRCLARLYEDR